MTSTLVERVREYVIKHFENEYSGHDQHHIERVFRMATYLQEKEGGNLEIIQLTALLHDISDHKLNGGKLNDGGRAAKELLEQFGADTILISQVSDLIDLISFKGALVKDYMPTLEGKIVQDADRLDAIGAIGVARAFAFGGNRNRDMFRMNESPQLHDNFEAYVSAEGTTINHIYEKLLFLNDRLHTDSAKEIGRHRHDFLLTFLEQFKREWNFASNE
jgi:uncharacterized protein